MTDGRTRRVRALGDLIRAEPHASQEELTERLRALGHQATQATVSRDLVSLGAVKVKREGALRYLLPDQFGARDWASGQLERIVRERAGELVDDTADSRWTLTVAGHELGRRQALALPTAHDRRLGRCQAVKRRPA